MPDPHRVHRSRLDFARQASAPAVPPTGAERFYVNLSGALRQLSADGTDAAAGGGGGVTQQDIDDAIAALVDSSPAALNTLNELAAAMGDDASFATTVTNALAGKQPLDSDLTAIAALTTTAYGRSLLALANQAALQSEAGAIAHTFAEAIMSGDTALGTTLFGNDLMSLSLAAGIWRVDWKVAFSAGTAPATVKAVLQNDAEDTIYDADEGTASSSGYRESGIHGWAFVDLAATTTIKVSASRTNDNAATAIRNGGDATGNRLTKLSAMRVAD